MPDEMRTGTFPGQLEALRREVRAIEQEERQKGTRRMFLGAAVGLVGGIAGGFGFGRWAVPSSRKTEMVAASASPQSLRALAAAPIERLSSSWIDFLSDCERAEVVDDVVCAGLHRLISVAMDGETSQRRELREYLIRLPSLRQLPPSVAAQIEMLAKSTR